MMMLKLLETLKQKIKYEHEYYTDDNMVLKKRV